MSTVYEEILSYVNTLPVIDSHEHLPGREEKRERPTDVLREYLAHYFRSDLISAGMPRADMEYVRDNTKPLMERWKTVEPWWELARNTAYGRALDLAAKTLYGIDRIDGSTIEALNDAFQKTLEPGADHFRRVLKDVCHIEYCVLDSDLACDREFFRSALNITELILPESWDQLDRLSRDTGVTLTCFDDYLDACTAFVENGLKKSPAALKCTIAYWRPLRFENVSREEADAFFREIQKKQSRARWDTGIIDVAPAFQDYVMHHILRLADRHGLVFQFHTGLQEGNDNDIEYSNPVLMTNLFARYPHVRFDLFHIGYPYQNLLTVLAKNYANVYINFCWAHIISPAAVRQTLDDMLDAVPANKIIAFGGDYSLIDGVAAHLIMAKENVSRVLARKVELGEYSAQQAKQLARRMFYDNPKALYGA